MRDASNSFYSSMFNPKIGVIFFFLFQGSDRRVLTTPKELHLGPSYPLPSKPLFLEIIIELPRKHSFMAGLSYLLLFTSCFN